MDNNNTHLTTDSITNINYITHNTPNNHNHNHNHNTHSINQQEFTPTEMPEGVDTAVLGSGIKTVLEPESAPFQSFQSFFSPQQSTHIGFEQMSMDNHPLSSTTGNIQGTFNDPRANLLISPRPRYTTRSFRGPNSEALSMGAIIDANHSASSLNRSIGSPGNNPSVLGTISSIVNSAPEANSEEMEKELLDYQIKGRSHVSIGYSGGLDADRWTAKGNQHSLGMESIPDDRSSRVTGRHSISKPKMSTSPAVTNSSAAISGSSEMLPLSEFLSQTADSDKPSTPSTEGLSRRTDDTELNYPMYSSFPAPPPPGFPGRVPITSASVAIDRVCPRKLLQEFSVPVIVMKLTPLAQIVVLRKITMRMTI
ncbi:hypothetical protein BGX21_009544 [Mortierella sp. AD011]|nr:hypothetical protein BGX20_008692 [Mortierella sp. AD010]KAF9396403.1 hypothetical protein BGX21_009544 [Mortierella sp. AD011]